MTTWHLGTMGFSYSGWRGVFYPEDLPQRSYLAHYSRVFNAVEIDSTFYGTPRTSTVRRWAAATPVGFYICPKVPQQITHELRLSVDDGAGAAMDSFLDTMRLLGQALGPVLIQLPPTFGVVQTPVLAAFLAQLPPDLQFAVELRDPAWYVGDTAALLQTHHVAWVTLDYLDLPKQVVPTADFLYVRWIGGHGRFPTQDREYVDPTPGLQRWWQALQPHLSTVQAIYGFFNDDYAGHGPATCNRWKSMAGLPVVHPELPQQGTLF